MRSHNLDVRLAFAETLEKLNSLQQSKSQYLLILDKKSNHIPAMERLAFLYYRKLKDKISAKNMFQRILNTKPNHPKKNEYRKLIQLLSN